MARRSRRSLSRPYIPFSVPALRVPQSVDASRRLEADRRRVQAAIAKLEELRRQYLVEIEDRRRFHPEGKLRPVRSRSSRVAKISALSLLGSNQFFSDPFAGSLPVMPGRAIAFPTEPQRSARSPSSNVIVCVRRKARREVLFARGVGGGKVSRRRRRSSLSNVFC